MKDIVARALVILYGLALFALGIYFFFDIASPNLFEVVLRDLAGESYFEWIDNIPFLYANAIAVCTPVMLLGFYSRLRQIRSISGTLERVAIPWSIFVSAYGFLTSFSYISNPLPLTKVMAVVASSLFAIVCGGLLAAVGYYLREEQVVAGRSLAPIDYLALFAILALSYFVWSIALQIPLADARLPLLFLVGCYALQNASLEIMWPVNRATVLELILKSVVPATLGGVLLSMVLWISAYADTPAIGPAMYLGIVSLILGSTTLAFVAVTTKDNLQLKQHIWRSTWHLLEIYALLILIIYAPVSGLEMIIQGDI